jgi:hypothetical protein
VADARFVTGVSATILVQVQPNARRTGVLGRYGDAVRVGVAAPPVNGAANAELIRCLAATLGIPRSAVAIAGGAAGRRKRIRITGLDRDSVLARLLAVAPQPAGRPTAGAERRPPEGRLPPGGALR